MCIGLRGFLFNDTLFATILDRSRQRDNPHPVGVPREGTTREDDDVVRDSKIKTCVPEQALSSGSRLEFTREEANGGSLRHGEDTRCALARLALLCWRDPGRGCECESPTLSKFRGHDTLLRIHLRFVLGSTQVHDASVIRDCNGLCPLQAHRFGETHRSRSVQGI